MAPPLLHFRLHPQCLLLPRLRHSVPARLVLRLSLKTLCCSSSDYSPPPLHGPSLRRGRAPPDHPDPFARSFDLAALRVPAAACAPLERRLRGHLLNWPRVRNVARLPNDQGLLALGLSLPSPPLFSAQESGTPVPPTTAVAARREKVAREFNARGFVRFPNLARLSRPSPAARKRRGRKAGGESDEQATRGRDKDKVYVVEVVGEGREGDEDDLKGLVGEEGLRRGAWRTGPSRLLLLDEKYAGRGVDELPEAVKVVLISAALDIAAKIVMPLGDGGIPAHAWGQETAEQLLNEFCLVSSLHTDNAERRDVFSLTAWCSSPSRIPSGMDLEIIEPPVAGATDQEGKRSLVYPVEISCSILDIHAPADAPPPPPPADHHGGRRCRRWRRRRGSPEEETDQAHGVPSEARPVHARLGLFVPVQSARVPRLHLPSLLVRSRRVHRDEDAALVLLAVNVLHLTGPQMRKIQPSCGVSSAQSRKIQLLSFKACWLMELILWRLQRPIPRKIELLSFKGADESRHACFGLKSRWWHRTRPLCRRLPGKALRVYSRLRFRTRPPSTSAHFGEVDAAAPSTPVLPQLERACKPTDSLLPLPVIHMRRVKAVAPGSLPRRSRRVAGVDPCSPGLVTTEAQRRVMRSLGFACKEKIDLKTQDAYFKIMGSQLNESHVAAMAAIFGWNIEEDAQRIFLSVFGTAYDKYVELPADGTRGGILIAWKSNICQILASRVDNYSISVQFEEQEGRNWWFTGVYGPQDDVDKIAFLQELRDVRALCSGPWLIAGDFNLIYQASDKNNTNLDRAMMGRFRRFLDDVEAKEIPLLGRKYTHGLMKDLLPPS
ncbi:unnamed protein product [Miscanthus lutarioriparius]|uniref:Endonuclease/exonuclease/phosphatase domain-containing protein n=1 Tax=Miscanthus lutarioriparius TaxID=422564 RepID=A0A811PM94_9POAL|nr:unnamed protein product [Miscanthus lutarioriparius]